MNASTSGNRLFCVAAVALACFWASNAAPGPAPRANGDQASAKEAAPRNPAPAIHVTTRLVQIGVIVRDKNGPVANLTQEDFAVFDRGKPQKISFFSLESGEHTAQPAAEPLPQNTFSDLPQYAAGTVGSITIVLLDNLNTLYGSAPAGAYESTPSWMEDFALANGKAHLIQFVKNLNPKDRVAIYGLRHSLHVLCDFTSDRSQLLAILKNYDTTPMTSRDIAEPGATHTPVPDPRFDQKIDSHRLDEAARANQDRGGITMAALQSIAAHVANIPGRKNLVWLTANLPFSGDALARILSPAQIAAYPIDARGLLPRSVALGGMVDDDDLLRGSMPAQSPQPIGVDTMERVAEQTGGEAFVNTNDITGAIRKAIEDSAVVYTLGFYVNPESMDEKFHELKVQVKPGGLTVRYPKGYFALEDAPATKDQNRIGLVTAIRSPIESSEIPLQVKVDRVNQPMPDSLILLGSVGIHGLQLTQNGEMRTGAVDVTIIEQEETGKVLRESANRINLHFTEAQYAASLKSGVNFRQFVQPQAGVTTLRVLVQDPRTAAVGSLIIPVAEVK
jgi:VWFA-related protein